MLTGNSGLIYNEDGTLWGHIAAPYHCNGMVFVDIKVDGHYHWKRVPLEEAQEQGLEIIKCSRRGCGEPAYSLDHHYPWMNDYNLCETHFKGGRKKRAKK